MTQVILLERVEKLGSIGDEVTVKPGFARNFLVPKGKALRATAENRKKFEAERAAIEARNAEEREKAETLSRSVAGKQFTVIRSASDSGMLFGSVSSRDIAETASTKKLKLNRQNVLLDSPIKTIGIFPVRIRLHPEVTVEIEVNVARTQEEAERQARGENVLAKEEEVVEKVTGTGFDEDEEGTEASAEAADASAEEGTTENVTDAP
ncbi:50S ribosomal protein L9 [Parvularcula lutaonensis]|uniref:Large ribosomal subunit protein bL9 n=1 Tax=Parvularcula lutaonensis TaxID=491923 RepID=A0ABV7M7R8_9PROT|nr:50S ribosomal protein L9 [Parvularcula lutaonensis]GGY42885.1 50S ribosomal protein L9 [Parvularcula lutaonensis]